ncbi:uncharacterized protein [Physeter macrocephalus]|uniref:Uncharacterized protein isoform X1 n=1 Tax=Physeter macrocephalus TaxID=9755 RepID=A0A455AVT6_PHYMC|nr:uncharacterized protein LOC102973991 isoform X1 [Physeter catodon]|eukprot:XP_028339988.1 nudC domain-containing protein 3 isoform X1 [Physeter catodon]
MAACSQSDVLNWSSWKHLWSGFPSVLGYIPFAKETSVVRSSPRSLWPSAAAPSGWPCWRKTGSASSWKESSPTRSTPRAPSGALNPGSAFWCPWACLLGPDRQGPRLSVLAALSSQTHKPGGAERIPSLLGALEVSLNKVGEYWWSAILEGEEQIDIDKINKERSMATVDEEEHAVLDRLTFDYHQKLQGKPQSHELKVHEMLKKGWDAEGSPFRGQRFDPAMFNISPGAVQF